MDEDEKKEDEKLKRGKECVVSTEAVNCYGTRILTAGIDTKQFERNPILLYMHNRYTRNDMPIGIIELRVDGDVMYGTPLFDMEDPDAVKIANKWEKGVLRMMSPSFDPIEWSDDPKDIKKGQYRATITKCKLVEVSIVDIGANDEALQLQKKGKLLELAQGVDNDFVPLLKLNQADDDKEDKPKQKTKMNEETLMSLGLPKDATEEQINAAIAKLKKENEDVKLAAINSAVEQAKKDGKIDDQAVSHFVELGKKVGLEELNKTLSLMSPAVKPSDLLNLNKAEKGSDEMKWSDLTPEKAEELKLNDRKKYIELYKAEFGFEPNV